MKGILWNIENSILIGIRIRTNTVNSIQRQKTFISSTLNMRLRDGTWTQRFESTRLLLLHCDFERNKMESFE
jgi:hypothetical protein